MLGYSVHSNTARKGNLYHLRNLKFLSILIKEKSYQSNAAIFLEDEGKCLIEEYKILKGTEARFYKTI